MFFEKMNNLFKRERINKLSVFKSSYAERVLLGTALLLLFIFCLYPFLKLFFRVLFPQGTFEFRYIQSVLNHRGVLKAFRNTFFVSSSISLLSIFIAVPVSWLLARTDLPMSRKLRSWFCLPYAIPPYVGAMAWIFLANPTTGLLNKMLGGSYLNIYSYFGLIWVETSFLYTFVLLTVLTSLDRMDPSLEEAARLSGASPFKVFTNITLPLMRPAIISGGTLVFLGAAASFGVPALIGSPGRIYLVTTQIYTFQKMGSINGVFQAAALSILLLLLSLLILFLNQWWNSGRQFKVVSGKASRKSLIELGRLKYLFLSALLTLFFFLFLLPLLGIVLTSFHNSHESWSINSLSFDHVKLVFFEMNETGRALKNSLSLALLSATFATVFAILLAFIRWKTAMKGRAMVEVMASLPFSIPGTVVALALILAFSRGILGLGPSLYNTMTLLVIAYLVKYLSLAIKTFGDGFGQIDDSLAEAARVSGANWWVTLKSIWLPLLKPSVVAAWFLIFMPAFSELTMTVLLAGPGQETLGTLIFQLQQYADPTGGASAVLALVVVLFVLMTNALVKALSRGKYGL